MARAVLIVEDEGILVKNLTRYLEREGFETQAVSSGEQGLPMLDSFRPDAVLLVLAGEPEDFPDLEPLTTYGPVRVFRRRTP